MTEKRFTLDFDDPRAVWIDDNIANESYTVINDTLKKKNIQEIVDCLNELHEENEMLKQDLNEYCNFSLHTILDKKNKEIEQLKSENNMLKVTIEARDTLVEVCEKKFRELGLIITVDDDGYVIE